MRRAFRVITSHMGYRNSGRLVGLLAGPLFLVVILGASPSPPASARVSAHQGVAASSGVVVAINSQRPAQNVDPAATGPTTTLPIVKCPYTEAPIATCRPCLPVSGTKQPTLQCQSCPRTYTEGPLLVRCPGPPNNQPPPAHPSISFCAVAGQPQPGFAASYGAVCGAGFRAGETLTLSAGGTRASVSWISRADSAGRFRSLLPPALCRTVPMTLVVTGSAGDRSNALTLTPNACLPRP
jgi:hypothetical protein